MTLLVLDLRTPVLQAIHTEQPLWASGALLTEQPLWSALVHLWPSLLAYLMSFLTLGIFWVGQQAQLHQLARSDRDLTWIHLAFLLAVTLMPFSTGLLAAYITYRLALLVYWLNLLLLGLMLLASWWHAARAGLVRPDVPPDVHRAHYRRILGFQALYALAFALCAISTYVSIVIIVLLQLDSAIAPRIGPFRRP